MMDSLVGRLVKVMDFEVSRSKVKCIKTER